MEKSELLLLLLLGENVKQNLGFIKWIPFMATLGIIIISEIDFFAKCNEYVLNYTYHGSKIFLRF